MPKGRRFEDRRHAGELLARHLAETRRSQGDEVVLGIARGGLAVAHSVAQGLDRPLDVVVVRKLGYPGHPEAGFGAIGEHDVLVPHELAERIESHPALAGFREVIENERRMLAQQVDRYRGGKPPLDLTNKAAIVVDDGVATGYTFIAALEIARSRGAGRLIGAAPVASREGARQVSEHCDELYILQAQRGGDFAVSLYYERFDQVDDEQVAALLG